MLLTAGKFGRCSIPEGHVSMFCLDAELLEQPNHVGVVLLVEYHKSCNGYSSDGNKEGQESQPNESKEFSCYEIKRIKSPNPSNRSVQSNQ